MDPDAPRVIRGVYSDYKPVRGRRVFQLIIEVPIEEAPMVHNVLGEPYGYTVEVAVARLEATKVEPKDKMPRRFEDMSPATQAALLCGEPLFAAYLRETYHRPITDKEDAAAFVREFCGVRSRADITTGSQSWRNLMESYQAWKAVENAY
jgi:hypothetical protein